ncbi:MAG: PD40 domain-containing protein [Ignavibacteria bacterium]|nr:PD40 domain-containing protein [Ignavibacteria bacterium]
MKKTVLFLLFMILSVSQVFPQFGRNKVQYKDYEWFYIQTVHFDIYFTDKGSSIAEFAASAIEDALAQIESSINYKIAKRISVILYDSQNEFQETNVIDSYLGEGTGGFTELFKNRMVLPFSGNYKMFRHVIHHELVHAVMNDLFYGGALQNVVGNSSAVDFPLWFSEGLAEYLSLGWDTNTDQFIRDAAINEYLPDIPRLDGYFAYRGGQAVFYYIAKKYGREKIADLIMKVKSRGGVDQRMKASIGMTVEELNERWKKDIKRVFWPDITERRDPDEFAKRLTDPKKDNSSYNISPAISPKGDKIVYISNKDYFFDVYLMDANTGKEISRVIKGNRTVDFEELNILTPGISWSPDGKKFAISAKSGGDDAIFIVDAESGSAESLPVRFPSVETVDWSKDGKKIVFAAQNFERTDIYVYDFDSGQVENLTDDIFSDADPRWSYDGRKIYFSSDRDSILTPGLRLQGFEMYRHKYNQMDLYEMDYETRTIRRLTNYPLSDEKYALPSQSGDELLFVSDYNGINNIYRINLAADHSPEAPPVPVTNSLNGLDQISASYDGKKLAMTAMYKASYNIFTVNSPFSLTVDNDSIKLTGYMTDMIYGGTGFRGDNLKDPFDTTEVVAVKEPATKDSVASDTTGNGEGNKVEIFTGVFTDTTGNYGDSVEIDYSTAIFGKDDVQVKDTAVVVNPEFQLGDRLEEDGDFKVRKYKINFSPDLVYANAGYSTYYGLLGTTVLSFSDVLGNHRLVGFTSLQIDLKNSDYGLAYYSLKGRWDIGIMGYHTARFVYLNRGPFLNFFRFRNYGLNLSASYPLNTFYRVDLGLSFTNATQTNLDDPAEAQRENTFLVPSIAFVHDNTIFGYTAPIDGTRYRLEFMANPFIDYGHYGFFSILGDYREYLRFWGDYSLAVRGSFGYSWGNNPQRFFIGGTENWINRDWSTGRLPMDSPSDFVFLSTALPMRGYNYAEAIGTKYGLVNVELRFPFIRYLITGGLPLFFSNIMGTIFFDAGATWSDNSKLQLFSKNDKGNLISKDLLMGTGFGLRTYFLYFLVRCDLAWAYNIDGFSKPIFYFSLGTDF